MTETEAVTLAKDYVEEKVQKGELFPCTFGWTLFRPESQHGPAHWGVFFPFTFEDHGGAVLHIIVDDATGDVSTCLSL